MFLGSDSGPPSATETQVSLPLSPPESVAINAKAPALRSERVVDSQPDCGLNRGRRVTQRMATAAELAPMIQPANTSSLFNDSATDKATRNDPHAEDM